MKTEIHDRFRITCTPENKKEMVDLLNILSIEPTSMVDGLPDINPAYMSAMNGETTSFERVADTSATEGGGGWMRNTVTTEYLKPYWERMKCHFNADPFDIDLTPACHIVTHTHTVERLWHEGDKTYYTSVFSLYPLIGEKLSPDQVISRAEKEAREDVAYILGKLQVDSEFIELGNGLFKRNHNARSRQLLEPDNNKIWEFMADTWLEKFGTVAQKLTIATRAYRGHRGTTHWDHLSSSHGKPTGLHLDNCNVSMTWEEFQKL